VVHAVGGRSWLAEFLRGGPDRCEECLRLGAEAGLAWVPRKVAEARGLRYGEDYWNAESAPIVEPRSGREQTEIKSAGQVHVVPAPGGGEAATTEGATSSPNGSPKAAAQTEPLRPAAPEVGTHGSASSTAGAASPPNANVGAKARSQQEDRGPKAGPQSPAFFWAPPGAETAKAKPAEEVVPVYRAVGPAVRWDEVRVPEGITELERLTYVPGAVGDVIEWIVGGAPYPNRMMALATAVAAVGTKVGRRIMGPTGSATHLYMINLAPTGYGKDHPLGCGSKLFMAAGLGGLLGPQEFASSPGLWLRFTKNPLMLCLVDELGDEFGKINQQGNNAFVSNLFGLFKKTYNCWEIVQTAETVSRESQEIVWPAISIVGAATPKKFFDAFRQGDRESGFANRFLILPFEGIRRPTYNAVTGVEAEPPPRLVAMFKEQRLKETQEEFEAAFLARLDGRLQRWRMEWGEGAQEVFEALLEEMAALEKRNPGHYELSMRVGENAVRLATVVAVGRQSSTVDRLDIGWGAALAKLSFRAAVGGFDKYMRTYLDLAEACEWLMEELQRRGGWLCQRDLNRAFRKFLKQGYELDRALKQLQAEERIRSASRGKAWGYELVSDGFPEKGS